MEIYSIVVEAKERTRGEAGGRGGGKETLLSFPDRSSLRRAHNLKTCAFSVCFMKAVACCAFL